jgi:diguanylate cyclase (GGDEF)-like protein
MKSADNVRVFMQTACVLIAEADAKEMRLMTESLEDQGYLLLKARSDAETIKILSEKRIDIAILAQCLPELDAYELCRRIRRDRHDAPLQIILISTVRERADILRATEVGFDDFIKQPFEVEELRARVKSAILRWQCQEDLFKEREFFRVAISEEEKLSSLVLDQNRNLKEAYERVRKLNEELEKTNNELAKIAAYDTLSGLLNRRSLFQRIAIEIERSLRLEIPLAGLMIDIDHFKSINDNYGHQSGDLVIREIGNKLQSGLRKYDYAGRYGGEEFFVVLSNSSADQAVMIAERFRGNIEQSVFAWGGNEFRVTVSIGVAPYKPREPQENWVDRADQAMYQAKQTGRNKTLIF